MTLVGLPNEGACNFAEFLGKHEGRCAREGRLASPSFISVSAAGFGSAYWEMSSLMLSSCSAVSVAVAGVRGDPRNELEPSCCVCLAACPPMLTGGVAELTRSLTFSSWAFNSAALLLIFVIGRTEVGVGIVEVGRLLKCGGEN